MNTHEGETPEYVSGGTLESPAAGALTADASQSGEMPDVDKIIEGLRHALQRERDLRKAAENRAAARVDTPNVVAPVFQPGAKAPGTSAGIDYRLDPYQAFRQRTK